MKLTILDPGPLTTVQDAGRSGGMGFGIGTAGVMDMEAFFAANALVGNCQEAAVLEMTLKGCRIRCTAEGVLAVTGAYMPVTVNGQAVPLYTAFPVKADDVVDIGFAQRGCRGYLAVSGGIDVPMVMGSRATDMKCGIGGFEGRKLHAGDVLQTGITGDTLRNMKTIRQPDWNGQIILRAVPGPQWGQFSKGGQDAFFREVYTMLPDSDRMGVRLSGKPIDPERKKDIKSDGIMAGSVQVTSGGQPIVMMADHQTTGGYAKIATVITCDLPRLAQARPGEQITFSKVTVREAQRLYRRWRKEQEALFL